MGILTLEELAPLVADHRRDGRTVVFTNGVFDILHRGHVTYLEEARGLGDILVVGINSDDSVRRLKGHGRPVNTLEDRARVVAALRSVDFVVPFSEDTPLQLIEALTPSILVKGGDYATSEVVGGDWVTRHGGYVHIAPTLRGYSTTGIILGLHREPGPADP